MGAIATGALVLAVICRTGAFVLGTYLVYEMGKTGIRVMKERKKEEKEN